VTEDEWLAVANLARLRAAADLVRSMVFMDAGEREIHDRWQREIWAMVRKYEKLTDGFISN